MSVKRRDKKNKKNRTKSGVIPQATRRQKNKVKFTDAYLGLFFNVFTKNSWRSIPVESVYSWLESKGKGKRAKLHFAKNIYFFPIIAEHIIYGSILTNRHIILNWTFLFSREKAQIKNKTENPVWPPQFSNSSVIQKAKASVTPSIY